MAKKENSESNIPKINSPKSPRLTGKGSTIPKPPTNLKPSEKPKK